MRPGDPRRDPSRPYMGAWGFAGARSNEGDSRVTGGKG